MTGAQVALVVWLAVLFIGTPLAARFADRHRADVHDYWHDQYDQRPLGAHADVEAYTRRGYANERKQSSEVHRRGDYPG